MSNLLCLPAELLLHIISYLPLQSLHHFRSVSKSLDHVISQNETSVYRQAAALHNYTGATDDALPSAATKKAAYPFADITTWKQYCQRCLELDRSWAGQRPAHPRVYCADDPDVHRIKVDEERGLLFTSHEAGGIRVTDLKTGSTLWSLRVDYVRTHAHLEYEQGYLIFDRFGGDKEVWRLATEFNPPDVPAVARQDRAQRSASLSAETRHASTTRGHLKPWAILHTPELTRAFRFSYPTLIVMSLTTVYLWDVPSATLTKTIEIMEAAEMPDPDDAEVMYVDVSERHVFVCLWNELRVFSRADGNLVLRISSQAYYANTRIVLAHERRDSPDIAVPLKSHILSHPQSRSVPLPSFVAAHVSRCGRHLVALLADNRLMMLEDFERVAKGQVSLSEAMLEVNLTLPESSVFVGIYLAYEHGRVSVVTTSGLYIFTLDAGKRLLLDPDVLSERDSLPLGIVEEYTSIPSTTSFPHLAACYIPRLHNKFVLINLSCLQMSATRLYVTWDKRRADILSKSEEGQWQFDIEGDNTDMYDEDGVADPPGPVMEILAQFGAVVLCLDFCPYRVSVQSLDY